MTIRPAKPERSTGSRILLDLLIIVVATVAVVWTVSTFFISSYYVPSGSMETTLNIGDRVFAQKWGLKDLHRGDVVVFKDPHHWLQGQAVNDGYLVKRIIGLPGDRVSCCDAVGRVQVNGISVVEPYVKEGESPSEDTFDAVVPAGQLWVMGDNRDESSDSRYHAEPFVPESDVVAKVRYVYYPFGQARWLEDESDVFAGIPRLG